MNDYYLDEMSFVLKDVFDIQLPEQIQELEHDDLEYLANTLLFDGLKNFQDVLQSIYTIHLEIPNRREVVSSSKIQKLLAYFRNLPPRIGDTNE